MSQMRRGLAQLEKKISTCVLPFRRKCLKTSITERQPAFDIPPSWKVTRIYEMGAIIPKRATPSERPYLKLSANCMELVILYMLPLSRYCWSNMKRCGPLAKMYNLWAPITQTSPTEFHQTWMWRYSLDIGVIPCSCFSFPRIPPRFSRSCRPKTAESEF